ncbi:unnamed protein product, partial [Linum tenue]
NDLFPRLAGPFPLPLQVPSHLLRSSPSPVTALPPEMAFFHFRKTSVPNLPCSPAHVAMEATYSPLVMPLNHHTPYTSSLCAMCSSLSSSRRLQNSGATNVGFDVQQTLQFDQYFLSKLGLYTAEEQLPYERGGYTNFHEDHGNLNATEGETKIEHGNKGKVPWNKGRKHSAETRELIRRRTIEALRDPQVKACKKLFGFKIMHSVEIKAKISSSLKRLWNKRLTSKRLGIKFFLSWEVSIAKAAKDGGLDEQRLSWNSYNEIEQEITRQQLQFATEKAFAKELTKIKSATVAKEKAEKIAQRKKEREEKEKARAEERRRSAKNREKSPVTQEFILKQKLVKIRRRKPTGRKVNNGGQQISCTPIWGKLDFELTEREELKRDSLADQIQAARNKRNEIRC